MKDASGQKCLEASFFMDIIRHKAYYIREDYGTSKMVFMY